MAEKHLKQYSTSFAIREVQIKTTLRFHLKPIRNAKIKTMLTAYAGEDVEQSKDLFIVGRSANLYSHFGNQYGHFSENWESVYLMTRYYHDWA